MAQTGSERNPAREDVLEHDEIAAKAVQRMGEGRRPVVFEEQMADPRETIPGQQRAPGLPWVARGELGHNAAKRQGSTREMQAPARAVRMLGQVERVELGEACETTLHAAHPVRIPASVVERG